MGYSNFSYLLSRFLAEVPLQVIVGASYCTIIYWSANLNTSYDRYLLFVALIALGGLCGLSLGLAISAISPSAIVALALGPPVLVVLILFSKSFSISVSHNVTAD